jgi:DsbC/DsbD-like thiol-disulfide interchange protein
MSTRNLAGLSLATVSLFAISAAALAADASDWRGSEKGKVRLVAGAKMADGVQYAGLQFDLAEGWKTYWRVPGDSGVPPSFEWKASSNVAELDVLFPAPARFRDNFGWNNGYKEDTLFPIRIKPQADGKPVQLRMTVYYGVCKELCIPGKAKLSLDIPAQGVSSHQALIGRYLRKVPQSPEAVKGLSISAAEAKGAGDEVTLSVQVKRSGSEPVTLFVEGPDDFYFEAPKMQTSANPAYSRYEIRVDGAKSAESLKGSRLRFTAVQGELRLEQPWTLD